MAYEANEWKDGESGGTPITAARLNAMEAGIVSANAAQDLTDVTGTLAIENGGTGNTTGLAASATKLATARTIRTNLASTATASFDGSANITPGVTGTLAISNGGTGLTSAPSMLTNLASTTAASPLQTSPRPGITGTLAIGHGGTGATSASAARTALSVPSTSETGTWTQFTYTSSSSSPTNWSGSANIKVYYNDVLNILWMQSNASIAYNGSSSTASAEWIAVDAGSLADRLEYRAWDSCVRITTSGIIGISVIYDSDSEEFKVQSFVTGGTSSATNLYVTSVLLLDLG